MVGKTKIVVVERRLDGAAVVGVTNRFSGTVGGGVPGVVVSGVDRTVVGGESVAAGTVVVVAVAPEDVDPELDPEPEEDVPDPEPVLELELPDESIVAGVARALPDRSGTVGGGVSSGGLALLMNRLKIWAGRVPPLTLV